MSTQMNNNTLTENIKKYLKATPGKIFITAVITIIVGILLSAFIFADYKSARQAVQTVGKDTVPSIITAEHIRAKLADANANAMNALMVKEKDGGTYWNTYRREMDEVHSQLIDASGNITYGNEERDPIYKMMSSISKYEFILGKARLTTGSQSADDFAAANKIMREEILPAASSLDEANYRHLSSIYSNHKRISGMLILLLIIMIAVTIVVIVCAQRFLYKKTRRILNIGFTIALGLTLIFGCYSFASIKKVEANLNVAKEEAFDSVHDLWKARSIAYDGNADESMYLLYSGNKEQQQVSSQAFNDKKTKITSVNPDEALSYVNENKKFGGFLGDELSNITFDGEKNAAMEALKYWADYIKLDNQFRIYEDFGGHDKAVKICTGKNEGESDWTFNKFDDALGKTIDINQQEFDSHIESSFKILNVFPFVLGVYLIAFIVAIVAGIKPRLDEYKF